MSTTLKRTLSIVFAVLLTLQVFSLSVFANTNITPNTISLTTDNPSEYGYSDIHFVDANGNEVNFNTSSELPKKNTLSTSSTLPASYDARNDNLVTPVKNQGYSGSCWSFSTMSALESDSIKQGIDTLNANYSEAHHVWFNENLNTTNVNDLTYGDGCTPSESPYLTGGNWITSIRSLTKWSGVAKDEDFRFYPFELSSMNGYPEEERYNTNSNIVLKSAECMLDVNDVKSWIKAHGSITATFYFNTSYLYNNQAYYYSGTNGLNHQIAIVGWDDNYSVSNFNPNNKPAGNGAWLVKNSWGTSFGQSGYHWLSYYDTSLGNFVGFTSQSAETYRTNYTYNGAGWSNIVTNQGTASIANVFKANEHEILSAISTYTMVANEKINVKIYTKLPSSYTSPKAGTLAASFSKTIKRAGYHTIELPNEINLSPNTFFSIIIEFVNTNDISYIPVEINGNNNIPFASKRGQSFALLPEYSSSWQRTENFGLNNVCIQAFTKCNHQPTTNTVDATCTENGFSNTVCTQCDYIIKENIIYSNGHTFGEWSEYVIDDTTGDSVRNRKCSECDYIEESRIKKSSGHGKVIFLDELMEMIKEAFENFIKRIIENMKEGN